MKLFISLIYPSLEEIFFNENFKIDPNKDRTRGKVRPERGLALTRQSVTLPYSLPFLPGLVGFLLAFSKICVEIRGAIGLVKVNRRWHIDKCHYCYADHQAVRLSPEMFSIYVPVS